MPTRAGGHVLGASGWEPDLPPRPAPPAAAGELLETEGEPGPAVNVDTGEVTPAGEPLPDVGERVDCPDCGKPVLVNKDGSLRKHTCTVEAPPPQVTFDSQEDDHGGDPAPEDR